MAADSGQTPDPSRGADPAGATDQEHWLVLIDPSWRPSAQDESPPVEATVGLWPIEDGGIGKFRPNPGYVPVNDRSPSDPLDAVLRLVMEGRADSRHIQLILRSTLVDVAFTGDGRPRIGRSPDEILCAMIATGEIHRTRIASPEWRRVDLAELVGLLNDRYDALFNPGGVAAVRLTADFLRQTLALGGDELSDMCSEYQNLNDLQIVPWAISGDRSVNEPDRPEPSGDPTTTAVRHRTTGQCDDQGAADETGAALRKRDLERQRLSDEVAAGGSPLIPGTRARLEPDADALIAVGAITAALAADLASTLKRDIIAMVADSHGEQRRFRFPPRGRPLPADQ